ncbi:hypothetical protein CONCODRAFT_12672 [Conidiobolus coronatus NRRL 28638]|uniref:Uncharacterized protein n=1 Tax=Conidiobolus coronatus (strain ATCC 28846 / CBS 209.66 / NRRL 28638) TaxID=796925 RepID=A0A137NSC9_CONC2|nr:hypothetical protein CONCODRAFT_12672 [Conidiobolus coronatus NRRL 28638]|eukprot:KXN65669.1 hypothetical protein CONCODRAFT_12672 [Conidiobolus coronatus NRRL 28638]
MLKYFLISLVPSICYAGSYQSGCNNNGVQKIELNATYNDKVTYYNAVCYNYKVNEDLECPEDLETPYSYFLGKECELYSEIEDAGGKLKQYHCYSRKMLNSWADSLKKKRWNCKVFASA